MKTRILTSLIGIPAVLALLFWPGGRPWFWFVAALMAMAIYEYTRALWAKGIYVHWIGVGLMAVVMLLLGAPGLGFSPDGPPFLWEIRGLVRPESAVLLVLLLLAGDMLWKPRAPLRNIGATFVGMGWLTITLPFLVAIRRIGEPAGDHLVIAEGVTPFGAQEGAWLMFAVLLVIWAGDSAAYFVGKAIGKHKMAPAVSPNKTWEGSVGGLAASWLAGFLMTSLVALPLATCLVFGLLVGMAGQIGDLVESSIKREIGIKDFGDLLPGHGGVLDRFDSLIFAAPVAYMFLYPEALLRLMP